MLARWTTDFDCGYETNWWYVIKDSALDLTALKAKRRYEINKGVKNFDVTVIDPRDYKEALFSVQIAAFSAYPEKYRPTVEKRAFMSGIDEWKQYTVLGAFSRESDELAGYALLSKKCCGCVEFKVLKTKPQYEKYSVNAALVAGVLQHFNTFLLDGGYISDGARNINHETAFQDYLEKYFGFRKAYCHLQIMYNPKIVWVIKMVFPFRKILYRFDSVGIIHQINSVMKMEELSREKE